MLNISIIVNLRPFFCTSLLSQDVQYKLFLFISCNAKRFNINKIIIMIGIRSRLCLCFFLRSIELNKIFLSELKFLQAVQGMVRYL